MSDIGNNGQLSTIISLRKIDATERQEQEAVMELYLVALGMLPDRGINEATSGDKN